MRSADRNPDQTEFWITFRPNYSSLVNLYLFRAKFTNDLNFFVHEVGRGRAVVERCLELQKCCEGVEGGNGDREWGCTYFGKKDSGKFIPPVYY